MKTTKGHSQKGAASFCNADTKILESTIYIQILFIQMPI